MRAGPKPLNAHIGMAMSYWAQEFSHAPESQQTPRDPQDQLHNMLLGIHKYQTSEIVSERLPLTEIYRRGELTINAIPTHDYNAHNPTVLLVPSMINASHILDLMPGRSLLRYLANQNINPYLLDWGAAWKDAEQNSFESLIMKRLCPAVTFLNDRHGAIHVLGYCMGGTLLAALPAGLMPSNNFSSMTLLSSPWDYHAGSQALLNRIKFWAPTVLPFLQGKEYLSQDWVQMLFASLDPALAAQKFSRFLDMPHMSDEARLFVAIEDWINDGENLPAGIARDCIDMWFLQNKPAQNKWHIADHVVDLNQIQCPTLIVASSKDRLVEYDMAAAFALYVNDAQIIDPACGHIGMIAGRRAIDDVWAPIADFVHAQT